MNSLPYRPNKDLKHFFAVTHDFMIGSGSMQGWRPTMEDCYSIIVTVPSDPFTTMFGVFDGHGGKEIADFVSKNIYYYVVSDPAYKLGAVKDALSNGFKRLDYFLMQDPTYSKLEQGSTAVVVLIRDKTLFCANLGDSRAVAYVKGEVVQLSRDHKPVLQMETARIVQSGCYVDYGRINGDLAMSRAFGDFRFKKNKNKPLDQQAVIAEPDVVEFMLTENWEFVVLACDGIWDTMTNEEVCTFVKNKIIKNVTTEAICAQLIHQCLCKEYPSPDSLGTDNMTIIIAVFLDNISKPYTTYIHNIERLPAINFFGT